MTAHAPHQYYGDKPELSPEEEAGKLFNQEAPCSLRPLLHTLRNIVLVSVVLSWGAWIVPSRASAEQIAGVAAVIDGDTIDIHGRRIRLAGIDAPESGQLCEMAGQPYRCGQHAALALADHVMGQVVTCRQRGIDRYGRIVAVCQVADTDLSRWLVTAGWALAYRRYSLDYIDAEAAARAAGDGIWRGSFVAPWDWRQGQRLPAEVANDNAPGQCLIKGNISSAPDGHGGGLARRARSGAIQHLSRDRDGIPNGRPPSLPLCLRGGRRPRLTTVRKRFKARSLCRRRLIHAPLRADPA
jgi:endonuclease YncB( thermonuclease family)